MKRCIEQQEHKIILWGKEYRDRFEVAEAFGINQASISYGISCKKMSLEEMVLDLLSWEPIWFEGKKYSTIVDLCACYQVQPSNVMERLRYGKNLHEVVYRPVRNNGKVFEIEYEGESLPKCRILMQGVQHFLIFSMWACPAVSDRQ